MPSLDSLISKQRQWLSEQNTASEQITTLLCPYRINPLGAHVDHQGGSVMAQPIDQYTILSFSPEKLHPDDALISVQSMQADWPEPFQWRRSEARKSEADANWMRYLQASINVYNEKYPIKTSLTAAIDGTLISAGLSSSASVILAYINALAHANNVELTSGEQIEMCRQVENNHMGLNNGVQDQMSIVFGRNTGLAILDVNNVSAAIAASPDTVEEVSWVLLFSGYSRELINSGFNTRVDECKHAASLLQDGATRLGDVSDANATAALIDKLPEPYHLRARHFYSEVARVAEGADLWRAGNWQAFGELMNASCQSSIHQYQSGSEALVTAHQLAKDQGKETIYGSRFGGGGYGGCLIMLVKREHEDSVCREMLAAYLSQFPDRQGIARCFVARPSNGIEFIENQST